jgi:uncharacterized protein
MRFKIVGNGQSLLPQSKVVPSQDRFCKRARLAIFTAMPPAFQTILLLVASNIFMTFAWYGHLRAHTGKPLVVVILLSWGIAFFEYCLMVPANRIGHATMNVGQLKILQEVITLGVFIPFAMLYLKEPFRLNFVWAGLCMVAAVWFMFRK